jgi:UDPglucose 6-dehydrogenase
MKITVVGTGYVGLVTAVCLAEHGHELTCLDVDQKKIDRLLLGDPVILEAGVAELMQKNRDRLIYTTDYAAAYAQAEVIFLCVGTPERGDGSANLSYINKAAEQIAQSLKRDCVIAVKSTVPMGTNDKLERLIRCKAFWNVNIHVASNPEFLSQGTAVRDFLQGGRIILGAETEQAREALLNVYKDFRQTKIVTDRRSAEMIKYASNNFLALKLSYINEIANLCELVGANIETVAQGMGLDDRIGGKFLKAGIGYGGSCFPKDTKALHWMAKYYDYEIKTVKAAIEVNESQRLRLIQKARKYYREFEGLTVSVLGLSFKPDTDDLREAPSLQNIRIFLDEGAVVRVWDPSGYAKFQASYPDGTVCCDSVAEAVTGSDLCLVMTEWKEVLAFDQQFVGCAIRSFWTAGTASTRRG